VEKLVDETALYFSAVGCGLLVWKGRQLLVCNVKRSYCWTQLFLYL